MTMPASPCAHRWSIEPVKGPVSKGTCASCGETREFRNYLSREEAEDLCQRHPGSPSPLETKPPKKEEETMPKLKPQAIKDKGQQLDVRPRRSPKRAGQSALMTTGRPAHRLQTLQDFLGKWADACAREHLRDTGVDCPECEDYAACQKWGDRVITSIMYRDKRFRDLQTGGTG